MLTLLDRFIVVNLWEVILSTFFFPKSHFLVTSWSVFICLLIYFLLWLVLSQVAKKSSCGIIVHQIFAPVFPMSLWLFRSGEPHLNQQRMGTMACYYYLCFMWDDDDDSQRADGMQDPRWCRAQGVFWPQNPAHHQTGSNTTSCPHSPLPKSSHPETIIICDWFLSCFVKHLSTVVIMLHTCQVEREKQHPEGRRQFEACKMGLLTWKLSDF